MRQGRIFQLPLRARMALVMLGVVAVLGLAVRLFIEQRLVEDMQQELDARAIGLATNLAAECVEPILYQDLVRLDQLLHTARSSWGDFEYAYVLDPTRRVLAHTFIGDFPDELRRPHRFEPGARAPVLRMHAIGSLHHDIEVPIYDGQLGVLHLGFQDASVVARLGQLRRDVVGLLAVVAAAGGLLAFVLVWIGLRPLTAVVEALDAFRPGRVYKEIAVSRHDEVGEVAQRVNEITLRLHQAQIALDSENRFATLGRFASVMSHEVGNPLASIMTRLELMEKSDGERFLRESLPLVRGQLGRIQKFLRGLSGLSRAQSAEVSACDISEFISEVIDVLRYVPQSLAVRINTEFAETGPVHCIRDQLFQVLLNLGLNGIRAAGPSGTVLFSTKRIDEAAVIEVIDDGPGVPPGIRDRIFEPFFSTAKDGMGLGLTISRDMVRQQGGDLRLISRDGQGACFQVRLPLADLPLDETTAEGAA